MNLRLLYLLICVLSYRFSSGQRLVSRGKTISSSSVVGTWTADKAVDGDARRAPNDCNCCAATEHEYGPWYKLDLGQQFKIYSISVLGRGGAGDSNGGWGQTLKNMQIKLGTTQSNGQEITRYTGNGFTYDYTLPTPRDGRYLILTLLNTTQYFIICELSVYADCIDGRYGSDCQETCGKCENDDPCNKGDGTCLRCRTGYKLPLCQDCIDGKYGSDCQEICGKCENDDPCNKRDGTCLRCRTGYKPPLCQDCIDGRYGSDCQEICGKCENDVLCNKRDGTCLRCKTGYKPPLCQECDYGYFGNDCTQRCFCLNSPCDQSTGICPTGGCSEGYNGDKCDTLCRNGTYGEDCRETCGQCYNNEICNHVDGHCSRCAVGYKGDDCKTECDSRTFGLNCSQKCGSCFNSLQCNKVNGSCPGGCDRGFEGVLCDATCVKGKHGEKCANSCGNCYQQDTCDAVTGLCTNNCSAGYTGTHCKEACPVGKFGRNCISSCGNCLNQTICSRFDGLCDAGCELGYKAPFCLQENAEIKAQSPEVKSYQLATAIVGTVAVVVIIGNVVAAICYMTRHRRKHRERPIQSQPVISNPYEMANRGAFETEHQYGQTVPIYEVPEAPYEISK